MPPLRAGVRGAAGLARLKRVAVRAAGAAALAVRRAGGDWSIAWTGCGCGLCDRLAEFLAARSERSNEWPLATPGRQHIHQQIDAAGLPVRHTTRRQGRPYTLLLAKTKDLFRREDEVRRQALSELAWLATAFE